VARASLCEQRSRSVSAHMIFKRLAAETEDRIDLSLSLQSIMIPRFRSPTEMIAVVSCPNESNRPPIRAVGVQRMHKEE
jgi:hypothetical protein